VSNAVNIINFLIEKAQVDDLDIDILTWIGMGKRVPPKVTENVNARLAALTTKGFLASENKIYTLTPKGKAALENDNS
jgi:hypothetical protein